MSTESTTYRIDEAVKKEAYTIFKQIGLIPSQAVNLFLAQVALRGGIPFEVKGKMPNTKSLKAIEESDHKSSLEAFESFSDLRRNLDL